MKILVVDDEKTIVKGIKFNLENEGYQVDVCYDGEVRPPWTWRAAASTP